MRHPNAPARPARGRGNERGSAAPIGRIRARGTTANDQGTARHGPATGAPVDAARESFAVFNAGSQRSPAAMTEPALPDRQSLPPGQSNPFAAFSTPTESSIGSPTPAAQDPLGGGFGAAARQNPFAGGQSAQATQDPFGAFSAAPQRQHSTCRGRAVASRRVSKQPGR